MQHIKGGENMSLGETIENGSEIDILYETRRIIAAQMDACENSHDISSLADKMVKLCERITELEKQQKPKRRTALDAVRQVRK